MQLSFDPTDDTIRASETSRWRHSGSFRWMIEVEANAPSSEPVPAFRARVNTLQLLRADGSIKEFASLSSIFNRSGATAEDAIKRSDAAVRYWVEQYGEEDLPG